MPFYGEAAGAGLTDLLKQHIMIAVELIDAAKSGDEAKFADQDAAWDSNAREIAAFLSGANPHWPEGDVYDLLNLHLSLTKGEAVARLEQNWDADVAAFDEIFTEILTVADALSDGLVKQFRRSSRHEDRVACAAVRRTQGVDGARYSCRACRREAACNRVLVQRLSTVRAAEDGLVALQEAYAGERVRLLVINSNNPFRRRRTRSERWSRGRKPALQLPVRQGRRRQRGPAVRRGPYARGVRLRSGTTTALPGEDRRLARPGEGDEARPPGGA